jgi:2-polyprenyl-6-methoxyphenol hydroxylase-like FAD-dependent oxidoreductase
MDKPKVLIVGAGIAGLALAAGLERHGINPTIVEVADSILTRGLGLLLTSNALLALRRIALDDDIIRNGIVQEHFVNADASETPTSDYDFRPLNARYAPNLGVSRKVLMDGLLRGVRSPIRLSTTVTAVQSSGEDVRVVLSDGTEVRYDLVVGADGIGSRVRSLIAPEIAPVYRSYVAWRTVVPGGRFLSGTVFMRHQSGSILGSFRIGPDLGYVFMLAHEPNVPRLSRGAHLDRLKELASTFQGDVPSLIQEQNNPDDVVFVPVYEVDTVPYYRGRVVLLGDAAHGIPPILAQGAAMAIEDGVVLSQALISSAAVAQALELYESRRRPRLEFVRSHVRRRSIRFGLEGPTSPELQHHSTPGTIPSAFYDRLIEQSL